MNSIDRIGACVSHGIADGSARTCCRLVRKEKITRVEHGMHGSEVDVA